MRIYQLFKQGYYPEIYSVRQIKEVKMSRLTMNKRIDRLDRMLRWLVLNTMMINRGELAGMNYSPQAMGKQIDELAGEIPNIEDILKSGQIT